IDRRAYERRQRHIGPVAGDVRLAEAVVRRPEVLICWLGRLLTPGWRQRHRRNGQDQPHDQRSLHRSPPLFQSAKNTVFPAEGSTPSPASSVVTLPSALREPGAGPSPFPAHGRGLLSETTEFDDWLRRTSDDGESRSKVF